MRKLVFLQKEPLSRLGVAFLLTAGVTLPLLLALSLNGYIAGSLITALAVLLALTVLNATRKSRTLLWILLGAGMIFSLMRNLRSRGVGILFVTHFLEQVYEVCDKITVLRNGGLIGEYETANLPRLELVSKMIGKNLDDLSVIHKNEAACDCEGTPAYEAVGLSSDACPTPFCFQIYKGEVNGFTGLLGSGRSECVRAIFGADKVTGGRIAMNGKTVKIGKPKDAMDDLHAITGYPVVITCNKHGIVIEESGQKKLVPAVTHHGPIDVCGAGDACTAGLTPTLCVGGTYGEAAFIGNLASGVTVRKIGRTGTVSREELLALYDEQWGDA